MAEPVFDPRELIATLDRHRVTYIIIGAFGRVIQGADEVTHGVDVVPSTRPENLRRLDAALEELNAQRQDGTRPPLAEAQELERINEYTTDYGELKVVPQPEGTRGYEDLRRAATLESIGRGLRPSIASRGDLSRMLSALGREEDLPKLLAMRRLMELEISRGIEI